MPLIHKRNAGSYITLCLTLLLVAACSGDGAGDAADTRTSIAELDITKSLEQRPTLDPGSCEVEDVNRWVYESMLDYYLFYDQVDRFQDASTAVTPEELIRDLRVLPNDRFSYVTDQTSYEAFFSEGEAFGYGWNFARDENNALLFSLIEPNSPLAAANVTRGETLLAINEFSIEDFANLSSEQQNDILGSGSDIRTLELTISSAEGQERQVSVTKAQYELQTVLDASVLQSNNTDVGYLSFYQFINTSSAELDEAFSTFSEAGISELVIDLRFNTGGRITVARELSSYVLGEGHDTDAFTTFAFNDKYDNENSSLFFQNLSNALSLNRVFVLQSASTCSASELVINSLRPFIDVVTIGDTTCGKPYATSPNIACDKVINALEIELVNANGVGDYFDGIGADCPVSEDLQEDLGSSTEPLLSTALEYIATGSCQLLASRSRQHTQKLTREWLPAWRGGNSL